MNKTNNFCNTSFIYILGKDKKPALTFSSDADSVYAHYTDKNTTKIDIEIINMKDLNNDKYVTKSVEKTLAVVNNHNLFEDGVFDNSR